MRNKIVQSVWGLMVVGALIALTFAPPPFDRIASIAFVTIATFQVASDERADTRFLALVLLAGSVFIAVRSLHSRGVLMQYLEASYFLVLGVILVAVYARKHNATALPPTDLK